MSERRSDGLRRSSGVRFAVEEPSTLLRFAGAIACLVILSLAAAAPMRRPVDRQIDAGTTPVIVRLPDQSRVTLGPGSSLRYLPDFAARRVWLIGRGTLEITPGPAFSIWTETALAKTTGASFDIRATGLATTYVTVRAGSVRLRALNEDNDPAYQSVLFGPGQRGFSAKMIGVKVTPP